MITEQLHWNACQPSDVGIPPPEARGPFCVEHQGSTLYFVNEAAAKDEAAERTRRTGVRALIRRVAR